MAVSLEAAVTTKVWLSFGAPELIPVRLTNWAGESSGMLGLPIGSSVGGSFTGLTVTVKVRVTMLLEPPPSLMVTVIVVEPDRLATGVNETVPEGLGLP